MRRVTPLLVSAVLSVLVASCASGPRTASQADIDSSIAEASKRFDMPELWIREVIRQESGGRTMANGKPIVSKAGAMGLMQLMPGTYEEMRRKHGLGSDPFDPHDNIIAGTAYLREMYNLFGAPGFLGAYNCGPGCYGDYLAGKRGLPGETKRYIASVGPRLNRTTAPNGADIVVATAADSAPIVAAPAPSYSAPAYSAPVADSAPPPSYSPPPSPGRSSVAVAALPPPTPSVSAPASTPVPSAPVTRVIAPDTSLPAAPATVSTAALRAGATGAWTVQLGAFRSADDSSRVIDRARRSLPGMLSHTQKIVQAVDTQTGPLYRARLSGLSQKDAAATCTGLVDLGMACFVVAPGA